ncbi:spermatogenesis-associated protein 2-like protein isoform X2 [Pleurodeles waltl]
MGSHNLVEEYRKCLERDCVCSVPSTCTDMKLKNLLQQRLEMDPELHKALRNEGALPLIDRALAIQPDVTLTLNGLVRAFESLELVAVNLCCFPWRKEFFVIKMFSGGYVHNLKSVFSEEDIIKHLKKMGYVKREEDQCFKVTHRPSMAELMGLACAFFAARVECEILAEIVSRLDADKVPVAHLVQERRKNVGGVDGCVERLRRLGSQMKSVERMKSDAQILHDLEGDIYTDVSEVLTQNQDLHADHLVGSNTLKPSPPLGISYEKLYNDSCDASNNLHRVSRSHRCKGNVKDSCDGPEGHDGREVKAASLNELGIYSMQSAYEHLDGASSSKKYLTGTLKAEICVHRAMEATYTLHDCVIDNADLSYRCKNCHMLHVLMCNDLDSCRRKQHNTPFISMQEKDAILKEVLCERYEAHSCIRKDSLPFFRCDLCQVLHYILCEDVTNCKTKEHPVHMIHLESDQKLWLRRTKLDALLNRCLSRPGSWV